MSQQGTPLLSLKINALGVPPLRAVGVSVVWGGSGRLGWPCLVWPGPKVADWKTSGSPGAKAGSLVGGIRGRLLPPGT